MTDEEILKLRSVLLVPDTLEECKRLVQLLWTNLIRSPWSCVSSQRLESTYYDYKQKNDLIAIEITEEGKPFWSSLSCYKRDCTYEKFQVIYLNSNRNMEARNITVTLEQARKWHKSNDETLKTLALTAYSEDELDEETWDNIYNASARGNALNDCAVKDIHRFRVLHKLSVIAAYFNKDWEMKSGKEGYFIGERRSNNNCIEERKVEILYHTSVMYSGIVYFKRKRDIEKAIELLGDDIKYLF